MLRTERQLVGKGKEEIKSLNEMMLKITIYLAKLSFEPQADDGEHIEQAHHLERNSRIEEPVQNEL